MNIIEKENELLAECKEESQKLYKPGDKIHQFFIATGNVFKRHELINKQFTMDKLDVSSMFWSIVNKLQRMYTEDKNSLAEITTETESQENDHAQALRFPNAAKSYSERVDIFGS